MPETAKEEFLRLQEARVNYPRDTDPEGYHNLVMRQEALIVKINQAKSKE